jgi:hypothetical protein
MGQGCCRNSFVIIADKVPLVKNKIKKISKNEPQGGIFMKLRKNVALFCLGGGAYAGLEMIWRGRTHGSMFALGGVCFLLLGRLNRVLDRIVLPLRAFAGAGAVTVMELLTGLVCNRDHRVWDYSGLHPNYRGQICLLYSLLWVPVSMAGMMLYRFADRRLSPPGLRCADGQSRPDRSG